MDAFVKLSALLALALAGPGARALEVAGHPAALSVSAGIMAPGSVTFAHGGGTYDLGTSAAPLLSGMLDVDFFQDVSFGVRINTARMAFDRDYDLGYDAEFGRNLLLTASPVQVAELMISGKARLGVNEKFRLQVALYLGYIRAFTNDPFKKNQGIGLNGAIEARWALSRSFFVFGEAGFLTQPYGGVDGVGHIDTYGLTCLTLGAGF